MLKLLGVFGNDDAETLDEGNCETTPEEFRMLTTYYLVLISQMSDMDRDLPFSYVAYIEDKIATAVFADKRLYKEIPCILKRDEKFMQHLKAGLDYCKYRARWLRKGKRA